jgi:soluble lytic murein transglycosylase-like protein
MDLAAITARSDDWGVVKMMNRISQIEARFGFGTPAVQQQGDFKAELQKSLDVTSQSGSADKVGETSEPDLFAAGTFSYGAPKQTSYDPLIAEAARKYGLDENLIRSVIQTESNFNSQAVSPKGAMGLMQLMPGTAQSLKVSNPFDPSQNIEGGSKYLRSMLDHFDGNLEQALSAYNAGPKAVETYKGVPPYAETQNYVKRVLGLMSGS